MVETSVIAGSVTETVTVLEGALSGTQENVEDETLAWVVTMLDVREGEPDAELDPDNERILVWGQKALVTPNITPKGCLYTP